MSWSTSEASIAALCRHLLERELSYVAVGLGVVTLLLVGVVLLFRKFWVRESRLRELCLQIATSLFALSYFLLFLDLGFFAFFTESAGSVRSLTGKRWFCAHWKPLNALGYRDADVSRLEGRRTVLVVGDSFAAGHGVDDYRDRFSNLLEQRLGDDWAVANVARLGWQTADETRALREFPHDPDVVVLSYCMNDIFGAGGVRELPVGELSDEAPRWLRPVLERSHLWDYVFLRLTALRADDMRDETRLSLLRAHGDPAIWSAHRRQLSDLVAVARRRGGRPLAVVWPRFSDPERSGYVSTEVARLFRKEGVPTIDLAQPFAGRPFSQLAASPLDSHPHARLHREVADLLVVEMCRLLEADPALRPSACGDPSDEARPLSREEPMELAPKRPARPSAED